MRGEILTMAKVSTGGGGNTGAGRTQGRRNRKEVAETASSTKENGRQKRGGIKDMKTKESVFCKKGPCGLFSPTYFRIFRNLFEKMRKMRQNLKNRRNPSHQISENFGKILTVIFCGILIFWLYQSVFCILIFCLYFVFVI